MLSRKPQQTRLLSFFATANRTKTISPGQMALRSALLSSLTNCFQDRVFMHVAANGGDGYRAFEPTQEPSALHWPLRYDSVCMHMTALSSQYSNHECVHAYPKNGHLARYVRSNMLALNHATVTMHIHGASKFTTQMSHMKAEVRQ